MRQPRLLQINFFCLLAILVHGLVFAQSERLPRESETKGDLSTSPRSPQGITFGHARSSAGKHQSSGLSFASAVDYLSGGDYAGRVVAADVNADGKIDLVVGNVDSIGVLIGNGDGTFQSAVSYALPSGGASGIAVADVNGDGKPDVVFTNCSSCGESYGLVGVLLGNGDGTFQSAVTYNSGSYNPIGIVVADVNLDGKPDLVVAEADDQSGALGVLLGNGDGTFQEALMSPSGEPSGFGLSVADLNKDGKPDVVITYPNGCSLDCYPGVVGVLLGNGDGTFRNTTNYFAGGSDTIAVVAIDLNKDGNVDLAVANHCGSDAFGPQMLVCIDSGSLSVFLGNGDGTFQPPTTYLLGNGGYTVGSLAVADVNMDGNLDLVWTNDCLLGYCDDDFVGVLLGNGDGTFQPTVVFDSGGISSTSVAVADVNGDGQPDLVVANACATACPEGVVGVLINTTAQEIGRLSPTSVSFGDQLYGTTSGPQKVSLFNDGDYQITVASVAATANYEVQTNHCLNGVKPHTHCDVYVVFMPGQLGELSGTLTFTDSAINSPQIAGLTGIGQSTTSTTLTTSPNPSKLGQSVTLTALVIPTDSGSPSGTVTFFDGTTSLGSSVVNLGTAQLVKSTLLGGSHSLTASYSGDAVFLPSASSVVNEVVKQAKPKVTLSSNVNPSKIGQIVTFIASVSGIQGILPQGTVTFKQGAKTLGSGTLANGQASFATSFTKAGTFSIVGSYSGDQNYKAAKSAAIKQIVQK